MVKIKIKELKDLKKEIEEDIERKIRNCCINFSIINANLKDARINFGNQLKEQLKLIKNGPKDDIPEQEGKVKNAQESIDTIEALIDEEIKKIKRKFPLSVQKKYFSFLLFQE